MAREASSFSNNIMEETGGKGFKLFASGEAFGFSDFPSKNLPPPSPPPPPPREVLPSQVSSSANFSVEPVHFDNLTLLKGRVSTKEVFGLPNSDLVPGVYEGGLKLWEGSLDLVKVLLSEVQKGTLSFAEKRVLELGCGHGIPGIFACVQGATAVHFQDYNAEVLQCLTIPNVNANIPDIVYTSSNEGSSNTGSDVRFFAGDWSQINELLPYICQDAKDSSSQNPVGGYDVILMAETIYSLSTHHTLYELLKKCVSRNGGTVYMAAKKYYFGVGGGIRQFLSLVEKDDILVASRIAEVADGSSNVREVWKLTIR